MRRRAKESQETNKKSSLLRCTSLTEHLRFVLNCICSCCSTERKSDQNAHHDANDNENNGIDELGVGRIGPNALSSIDATLSLSGKQLSPVGNINSNFVDQIIQSITDEEKFNEYSEGERLNRKKQIRNAEVLISRQRSNGESISTNNSQATTTTTSATTTNHGDVYLGSPQRRMFEAEKLSKLRRAETIDVIERPTRGYTINYISTDPIIRSKDHHAEKLLSRSFNNSYQAAKTINGGDYYRPESRRAQHSVQFTSSNNSDLKSNKLKISNSNNNSNGRISRLSFAANATIPYRNVVTPDLYSENTILNGGHLTPGSVKFISRHDSSNTPTSTVEQFSYESIDSPGGIEFALPSEMIQHHQSMQRLHHQQQSDCDISDEHLTQSKSSNSSSLDRLPQHQPSQTITNHIPTTTNVVAGITQPQSQLVDIDDDEDDSQFDYHTKKVNGLPTNHQQLAYKSASTSSNNNRRSVKY